MAAEVRCLITNHEKLYHQNTPGTLSWKIASEIQASPYFSRPTMPASFAHADSLIEDLRLYKDETEIKLIKQAAAITNHALHETVPFVTPLSQEKDIDCGIREFTEETGYSCNDFKLIENIIPYEEIFIGSNIKSYKHKYYLACMSNNTLDIQDYQKSEVKNIKWMSFDECLNYIRPYNLEKINIIEKINKVLQEYRLYS
jgi:8-oxo-dGTP pyrophosphatase MutT (NUDIX family)